MSENVIHIDAKYMEPEPEAAHLLDGYLTQAEKDKLANQPDIYSDTLAYKTALMHAKLGRRISRKGWINSDNLYLFYVPGDKWRFHGIKLGNGAERALHHLGFLAMVGGDGSVVPYEPNYLDINEKDWKVEDPEQDIFAETPFVDPA